ncbi:MAG TPA: chromosome partitioning protein ParB [Planctomycetaceae bacterium]|nr:chromosome partitioning protein ParB [Planctomycetaceae bacterium]
MSKERRLGRGLEALLGRAGMDQSVPPTDGTGALASEPETPDRSRSAAAQLILHKAEDLEQAAAELPASEILTASIDPNPWQPRSEMSADDLIDLASSLEEHGLVQPIVVRSKNDRYQLIAGQRRLAAARRLGWEKVPVRLLEVNDRQMSEIAIVENLQRRDLDPLEKATSFKQYLSTWGGTQEELAKRLSVDRSTVANLIRLLELPEVVQQKLRAGKISMGHARALLPLGDEHEQVTLAEKVVTQGLSVRAVESEIQEILRADEVEEITGSSTAVHDPQASGSTASKRKPGRPASRRSSQIVSLENELRRAVGTKVVIHANSKGAGRIVIPFGSPEEFERLLEFLKD